MDAQKTHFADDETLKHIDRLQAINAELVAALEDLLGHVVAGAAEKYPPKDWGAYPPPEVTAARAALSKAKES